jgi:hypothetical protein
LHVVCMPLQPVLSAEPSLAGNPACTRHETLVGLVRNLEC